MTSRLDPITADEWNSIRNKLPVVLDKKMFGSEDARQYAKDAYGVVFDALWETGAHPSVFADPVKNRVQVKQGKDGFEMHWRRPKTRRVCIMPVTWDVALSLSEYLGNRLGEWPVYSTKSILRTMRECAKEAGVADVTPKTLRHTVAFRIFKALGPSAAKESLGVSDKVLQDYMAMSADTRIKAVRGLAGGS